MRGVGKGAAVSGTALGRDVLRPPLGLLHGSSTFARSVPFGRITPYRRPAEVGPIFSSALNSPAGPRLDSNFSYERIRGIPYSAGG